MTENVYNVKPKEPKLLPSNYTPGIDNISSHDFLKIYLETLKYQDPFQEQDVSKMLDDLVKLNQVRYLNSTMEFFKDIKGLLNQVTMLSSISLIGKSVIFSTQTLNTLKGSEYYILSGDNHKNAVIKIFDGDTLVKEIKQDLRKGLNLLDVKDLPKGQYTVKVYSEGLEISDVTLGTKESIKSVMVMRGDLFFELSDGSLMDPFKILYVGG